MDALRVLLALAALSAACGISVTPAVPPYGRNVTTDGGVALVLTIPPGKGLWMVPHPPHVLATIWDDPSTFQLVMTGRAFHNSRNTNAKPSPEYKKYYGDYELNIVTFNAANEFLLPGGNDFVPLTVPVDPSKPSYVYAVGDRLSVFPDAAFKVYDLQYHKRFRGASLDDSMHSVTCPINYIWMNQGQGLCKSFSSAPSCNGWNTDDFQCCDPNGPDNYQCQAFQKNLSTKNNISNSLLAILITMSCVTVLVGVAAVFYLRWTRRRRQQQQDSYINLGAGPVVA